MNENQISILLSEIQSLSITAIQQFLNKNNHQTQETLNEILRIIQVIKHESISNHYFNNGQFEYKKMDNNGNHYTISDNGSYHDTIDDTIDDNGSYHDTINDTIDDSSNERDDLYTDDLYTVEKDNVEWNSEEDIQESETRSFSYSDDSMDDFIEQDSIEMVTVSTQTETIPVSPKISPSTISIKEKLLFKIFAFLCKSNTLNFTDPTNPLIKVIRTNTIVECIFKITPFIKQFKNSMITFEDIYTSKFICRFKVLNQRLRFNGNDVWKLKYHEQPNGIVFQDYICLVSVDTGYTGKYYNSKINLFDPHGCFDLKVSTRGLPNWCKLIENTLVGMAELGTWTVDCVVEYKSSGYGKSKFLKSFHGQFNLIIQ
jgi:hypothetical protein